MAIGLGARTALRPPWGAAVGNFAEKPPLKDHQDHVLRGGHFRIVAKPPDVVCFDGGGQHDSEFLRLFDGDIRQKVSREVSPAPVAAHEYEASFLRDDLRTSRGNDIALPRFLRVV